MSRKAENTFDGALRGLTMRFWLVKAYGIHGIN